uniref:Solute carrier family 46 member 3 n=1 Tax=Magallana gigas TaxID=29159 RepID=A0A8W8HQN3_MAGGI
MKRQDEIRESYIRVFIPVCASIFFIFESDVHCVYTAYEYGHKTFQKQLFPNISNASSSEESLCETNTSSQAYKDEQVVQQVVARWGVYINLAQRVPLVFSSLLFSSLSDSMGRKPLLFIVAIGFFTKQLLMTLAMEISIFETVKTSISKLVVILGMKPMQRCLMDELIALIGILSCTAMFVLFGVAQTETFLYIGVLFGSIAVGENICNLSSSVIGGAIYSETVALYRGTAYFVLTGFLVLSAFLLLAFIKNDKKNHNRKDYIAVE